VEHLDRVVEAARQKYGPVLMEQIQRALDVGMGTHEFDDVIAGCLDGRYQAWEGERSLVVTEIVEYPRLKAVHAWLAAGDLDEIFGPIMQRVEAFGRANGCVRLTGNGRHGWTRAGKAVGFECPWSVISKDISEGEAQ
jgi:hypothetical protein